MIEYSHNFTDRHVPFWKKHFAHFIDKDRDYPIKMMEIGCFEGRSTAWFLENICHRDDDKLICVDPHWENEREYEERFWQSVISVHGLNKIVKHKQKSSMALSHYWDNQFDLVYIDGDHEGYMALLDGINALRVAKVGGFVLFDDYLIPQEYTLENGNGWSFHRDTKTAIDTFYYFCGNACQLVEEHQQSDEYDIESSSSQILFRKTGKID
jgi:predicted O-methyltransferase YrrM